MKLFNRKLLNTTCSINYDMQRYNMYNIIYMQIANKFMHALTELMFYL